jgi:chromosome segregation ATPase
VTAGTPHEPGGGDVSSILGELERRLRRLEAELTSAAPNGADADRLLAEARARLRELTGQVDELLRFREQLHRTARELEAEYGRLLERIERRRPSAASPTAAADVVL